MTFKSRLAIAEQIAEGMRRFPSGPPQTKFITALQDRVNRLIATGDDAERSGIAAALIMSLRQSEDPQMQGSDLLKEMAEALIDEAAGFIRDHRESVSGDHVCAIALRTAHNRLQAVYSAVVPPEEPPCDSASPAP